MIVPWVIRGMELRMMPFLKKDDVDDELSTNDIHPNVPMREGNFKKLLQNSDNDVDSKRWLVAFSKEWNCKVFLYICK